MDPKTIITTFAAVFIAELGDKTQLATLGFAGESQSRWSVFVGAALALVCTSAIAALAGGAVAKFVSPVFLQRGAGLLFVALGMAALWQSFR